MRLLLAIIEVVSAAQRRLTTDLGGSMDNVFSFGCMMMGSILIQCDDF